ncbi:MAG TPA: phytanoyl-CoA dioxygenase family protein [Candidatus Acidoferrum sp.]|nr:phytanoyl-CoA dioxygenase family protein [Candidatus Acidoferrum sp.]
MAPGLSAASMCNVVWDALRRHYDVRRDTPDTWDSQRIAGTHDLPKSATFAQVASPAVREALDVSLGRGNWEPPERWGSLLATFPESSETWNVPYHAWHLDYPRSRSTPGLFAVRVFTCLAKLTAGGGGTVFVQGSHRLVENLPWIEGVERIRSADARKALIRTCPWVKELCSRDSSDGRVQRFMEEREVFDDVDLRVVEMTGEPGDVLLTHPLLLHAAAKNCAAVPRIVLSSTVYRSGVSWSEIYS